MNRCLCAHQLGLRTDHQDGCPKFYVGQTKVVNHPSPHGHGDADLVCVASATCCAPLAGCASGLFCVRCGVEHVAKKRYGYADLKPSTYFVPA